MTLARRNTPKPYQRIVRAGGSPQEVSFSITDHDLAGGDWNIPENTPTLDGDAPVGGATKCVVALESEDSRNFNVTLTWKDKDGNVLYVDDANRLGTSLAGQFVRVTADVAGDYLDVNITDTSGGAQNVINGSINIH